MAEAYKGLTIRIGADTSDLNKALSSSNKAARAVQTQLNGLTRAAKLDPKNYQLLEAQLGQVAAKALTANSKLLAMQRAVDKYDGTGIAEMARNTQDVALQAKRALERYNALDEKIATLRSKLAEMSGLTMGQRKDMSTEAIDAAIAKEAKLNSEVSKGYAKLRSYAKQWEVVASELEQAKSIESFAKLQNDLKKTESEARVAAKQFAELKQRMIEVGTTASMRETRSELESTKSIVEGLEKEFKVLEDALTLDPKNMDAALARMRNLKAQAEELANEERLLKEQAEQWRQALNSLGFEGKSAELSKLYRDSERIAQEFEQVSREASAANAKVSSLQHEMSRMDDAGQGATGEYKKLSAELDAARKKASALKDELRTVSDKYNAAALTKKLRENESAIMSVNAKMKTLGKTARSVSDSVYSAFSSVRNFGYGITGSVMPTATMAIYNVVDAADTVDSAYRDMRKTVQATEEEYENLKDSAIEYSKSHVTSADTMLEIEAMAGQLGVATEDVESFATVVSNLDIATDIDADTAAEDLGKLINVIDDLNTGNVDKFGDSLVRLGNNEAAMESDIVEITTRFGAMGSQVGMSADEILAWATAASATGVKSEAAGSAMQRTLSNMNTAVSEGGDKLKAWAKVAGVSVDEFKSKWDDGAGGTTEIFNDFINGLNEIDKSGGSVDSTLISLGITGVRQKQLLQGMASETDQINEMLTMSKDAWNGVGDEWGQAGDAAVEAQKKSEGFSGSLGILKNSCTALAEEVGDDLIPWIESLTGIVNGAADMWNGFDEGTKQTIIQMGLFMAAAGPVAVAIGSIGQFLVKIVGVAKSVYGAWDLMTTGIKVFAMEMAEAKAASTGMASTGLLGNLRRTTAAAKSTATATKALSVAAGVGKAGLVGLGIAAAGIMVTSMIEAKQAADEYKASLDSVKTISTDAFSAMSTAYSEAAGEIGEVSSGAFDGAIKSVGELRDEIQEAADGIDEAWGGIADTLSEGATQTGTLESYKDTIEELGHKTGLSKDELGELQTAIDEVNKATGSDLTYDEKGGFIKSLGDDAEVSKKKIDELIQSQQISIMTDSYSSAYSSALEEEKDLAQAKVDAQKALNDYMAQIEQDYGSEEELRKAAGKTRTWGDTEVQENPEAVNALQTLKSYKKTLEEATTAYDNTSAATQRLKANMDLMTYAAANAKDKFANLIAGDTGLTSFFGSSEDAQYTALQYSEMLDAIDLKFKNAKDALTGDNAIDLAQTFATGDMDAYIEKLGEVMGKDDEWIAKRTEQAEAWAAETYATEQASNKLADYISSNTAFTSAIGESEIDLNNFIGAVGEAGIKVKDLKTLTSEQQESLVKRWVTSKDVSTLKASFNTIKGNAITAAKETSTQGVAGVQSGISGFRTAGVNSGEGYKNGILSKKDEVYGACVTLANVAQSGLNSKEGQDSHSPSKKTYRSGAWFSQGFANGIADNTSSAVKAARKAGTLTAKALDSQMRSLRHQDMLDITPRVREAVATMNVNTTGLKRQMAQMGAMLSGTIDKDRDALAAAGSNYYIDGIQVDEQSAVGQAVKQLTHAVKQSGRA